MNASSPKTDGFIEQGQVTNEPVFTPGELKPGTILDERFKVIEMTHRGGMACIYKAENLESRGIVAIKVPLLKYESEPVTYSRFEREEEISLSLDNPHILKVIRVPVRKSRPYLVMEFLDGQTLNERMAAQKPLPEKEAASIASQVCDALECLRLNGIVHRDLKPENIMIGTDKRVRIFDFGIAKATHLSRLTFSGLVPTLGTPDYMAPEQVMGSRGDHRTDIYSLGAILYEMATGKLPFEGDSPFVVMNSRLSGDPLAPRLINPSLTPVIEEIILHSMARDPEDRYATAVKMKSELDDYELVDLTDRYLRLKPVQLGGPTEPPWMLKGVFIALVVISLQLLVFGLLFWRFRSKHG